MANTENLTRLSGRAFLGGGSDQMAGKISIAPGCLAQAGAGCRSCEDFCPERAIQFRPRVGGTYFPELHTDTCTDCLECLQACPVGAIASLERTVNAQQS